MTFWYWLLQWLPFEWAQPGKLMFIKNAVLAILLLAPVFGLIGTLVVSNRMAFFSDALGHGAFTGLVIGSLMGAAFPMWVAVAFSVLFASLVTMIRHRSGISTDTVIGVMSSTAVALGLFLATGGGSSSRLSSWLVGDVLAIGPSDIGMLLAVLAVVLAMWVLLFNRLLLASVHGSLARSRGVRLIRQDLIFTVIVAVIVTVSMPWIGLLVINSFLILPAGAARNIAWNTRSYTALSVAFAWFSGLVGLWLSWVFDSTTGATIVLVMALIFFLSLPIGRRLRA